MIERNSFVYNQNCEAKTGVADNARSFSFKEQEDSR
jgi:hypothetical protein